MRCARSAPCPRSVDPPQPDLATHRVTERNGHRIVVDDLGYRIDVMISTPDGDAEASLDSAFTNVTEAKRGAVDHSDRLDDARLRAETPEDELGDLALRQMLNGQDPDSIQPPF